MYTPDTLNIQIIAKMRAYLGIKSAEYICPLGPIQKQELLGGWKHFMEGRIHEDFTTYMQAHYEATDEKYMGKTWTAGLIQRIWTLIHRSVWTIRNETVHKKSTDSKITRDREDLQHRVSQAFSASSPTSFLAADQHLFSTPLDSLLKQSNMALRAWLDSHRTGVEEAQKSLTTDQKNSKYSLSRWLVPKGSRFPIFLPSHDKKKRKVHRGKITQLKQRVGSNHREKIGSKCIRLPHTAQWKTPPAPASILKTKEYLRRTGSYRPP